MLRKLVLACNLLWVPFGWLFLRRRLVQAGEW